MVALAGPAGQLRLRRRQRIPRTLASTAGWCLRVALRLSVWRSAASTTRPAAVPRSSSRRWRWPPTPHRGDRVAAAQLTRRPPSRTNASALLLAARPGRNLQNGSSPVALLLPMQLWQRPPRRRSRVRLSPPAQLTRLLLQRRRSTTGLRVFRSKRHQLQAHRSLQPGRQHSLPCYPHKTLQVLHQYIFPITGHCGAVTSSRLAVVCTVHLHAYPSIHPHTDGAHCAAFCYTDACMAWQQVRRKEKRCR